MSDIDNFTPEELALLENMQEEVRQFVNSPEGKRIYELMEAHPNDKRIVLEQQEWLQILAAIPAHLRFSVYGLPDNFVLFDRVYLRSCPA